MSVNFKWVANNDDSLYPDFIEAYNKGLTIKQIEKSLGLSKNRQKTFYRHAREEGLLKLKKNPTPRYYYYSTWHRRWVVKRKTKKSLISILCQSEQEAKRIVERLTLKNWSTREAEIIRTILRTGGEL